MIVEWTPGALLDLTDLQAYIAQDSPMAADLVTTRITSAVDDLADNPAKGYRGREGAGEGVYELIVPRTRYTVAYRIKGNVVQILALVRQAQRRPNPFMQERPESR